MQMTYLGQAGLIIEAGPVTIVCDPWLSDRGAFVAGWFPLPANQQLIGELLSRPIDYIYLSHSHLDHFDADTLARLPRSAKLLVAGFPSQPWRKLVNALGFAETHVLRSFAERTLAPGLTATIVHAPTPFAHDSALIVADAASGEVIVNLNDCKLDDEQQQRIRARFPQITVALAQFSGATWFPFVYDFPEEERVAAAQQKNRTGMNRWTRYMRALAPRWCVPFAGPPAILAPETFHYQREPDSIFTTPRDLLAHLATEDPALAARTPTLLPGDTLDLTRDTLVPDAAMHAAFSWDDPAAYVDAYAARMQPQVAAVVAQYPWPTEPLYAAFRDYFLPLFAAAPTLSRAVDACVLFEVDGPGGGRWLADFRAATLADCRDDPRPREQLCDYAFRLDSRYMAAIVAYRLRWDDFLLSFRFRAWRPSVAAYNENLITFLRFAQPDDLRVQDALLSRAQRAYDEHSFPLETAAGHYEVQQRCPHMGEQLSPAHYDAERGVIVCSRHGWTFAVPSGDCQNARATLRITPASPQQAAGG